MTNLFLYVLGFVCLAIVGLLFLDAHIAKRRMRQWTEDWKPTVAEWTGAKPPNNVARNDGNTFLPKRRKVFHPGVLISVVIALLLVAIVKRQDTSSHQVPAANPEAQTKAAISKNGMAAAGDQPDEAPTANTSTGSFMGTASLLKAAADDFQSLQVNSIWDSSEWMDVAESPSGSALLSKVEDGLEPFPRLSLDAGFLKIEEGRPNGEPGLPQLNGRLISGGNGGVALPAYKPNLLNDSLHQTVVSESRQLTEGDEFR